MGGAVTKSEKRVVIIGSGPAGALLAKDLAKYFHVTVISPTNTIYHKIGTVRSTAVDGWEAYNEIPLSGIAKLIGSDNIIHDSAVEIEGKKVKLASGKEVEFDFAIIAIGSTNAFANLGGNAYTSADDRNRDWATFRDEVKKSNNIVVVGGGAVGVEVAAEIKTVFKDKSVTVVHSAATLINSSQIADGKFYPGKFTDNLQRKLEGFGVKVLLSSKANASYVSGKPYVAGKTSLTVEGPSGASTLEADLVINAMGNFVNTLKGVPEASLRGIKVDEYFRVSGLTNVFAVGDVADSKDTFKTFMGLKAHATLVTKFLIAAEHGKSQPKPYVPNVSPVSVIALGTVAGVGVMGTTSMPEFIVKSMKGKDLFTKMQWGDYQVQYPAK